MKKNERWLLGCLLLSVIFTLCYNIKIETELQQQGSKQMETVVLNRVNRIEDGKIQVFIQGRGDFLIDAYDEWNLTSGDTVQIINYEGDSFLFTKTDVYAMEDVALMLWRERQHSTL